MDVDSSADSKAMVETQSSRIRFARAKCLHSLVTALSGVYQSLWPGPGGLGLAQHPRPGLPDPRELVLSRACQAVRTDSLGDTKKRPADTDQKVSTDSTVPYLW